MKKYFDGNFAKKLWGKIFEITTLWPYCKNSLRENFCNFHTTVPQKLRKFIVILFWQTFVKVAVLLKKLPSR